MLGSGRLVDGERIIPHRLRFGADGDFGVEGAATVADDYRAVAGEALIVVDGPTSNASSICDPPNGCVRSLIEIFGACALITERPGTAPNFLEDKISAGKLYAAAARGHSGLKGDIRRLHRIVHPMSGAILAGSKLVDNTMNTAIFTFGLRPLRASDGREGVIVLANIAGSTTQKLKELASNPNVLSAGKVILGRINRP